MPLLNNRRLRKLWQEELCQVRVFAGETHSQKVLFETTQTDRVCEAKLFQNFNWLFLFSFSFPFFLFLCFFSIGKTAFNFIWKNQKFEKKKIKHKLTFIFIEKIVFLNFFCVIFSSISFWESVIDSIFLRFSLIFLEKFTCYIKHFCKTRCRTKNRRITQIFCQILNSIF